ERRDGLDQVAGRLVGAAVHVDVAQTHRDPGGGQPRRGGGRAGAQAGAQGGEVRPLLVVVDVRGRVAGGRAGPAVLGHVARIVAARLGHRMDLVVNRLIRVRGR